jgi:hypothetical protein
MCNSVNIYEIQMLKGSRLFPTDLCICSHVGAAHLVAAAPLSCYPSFTSPPSLAIKAQSSTTSKLSVIPSSRVVSRARTLKHICYTGSQSQPSRFTSTPYLHTYHPPLSANSRRSSLCRPPTRHCHNQTPTNTHKCPLSTAATLPTYRIDAVNIIVETATNLLGSQIPPPR